MPAPVAPRPDPAKMSFEQLHEYLERELPRFNYTVTFFGRGQPVAVQVRHGHPGLTKYDQRNPFMAMGGMFGTVTAGFRALVERYHKHLDEEAEKERRKRLPRWKPEAYAQLTPKQKEQVAPEEPEDDDDSGPGPTPSELPVEPVLDGKRFLLPPDPKLGE